MNKAAMPIPQGQYCPATRSQQLVFTAGMTPRENGKLIYEGRVDSQKPIDTYKPAVQLAAHNALTAAKSKLTENESISQIVAMTIFIAADDNFTKHSKLADFAYSHLHHELGQIATCSRAAIGVKTLPSNAPVEITLVVEIGNI